MDAVDALCGLSENLYREDGPRLAKFRDQPAEVLRRARRLEADGIHETEFAREAGEHGFKALAFVVGV